VLLKSNTAFSVFTFNSNPLSIESENIFTDISFINYFNTAEDMIPARGSQLKAQGYSLTY